MNSIKKMSEEYLVKKENEILNVHDRYAGFIDGATQVLEQIEHACMKGVSSREKYDSVLDTIKQLKQ